jgi:hypothetical protein
VLHRSTVGFAGVGLRGMRSSVFALALDALRMYPGYSGNISDTSVEGAAIAQEARGVVDEDLWGDGLDEVIIGAGA